MRFSGTCVLASRLLNEPDRLLVLPKLLLLLSSRL